MCLICFAAIAFDLLFPIRYYAAVKENCDRYGVEPSVALAVIWTESKFRSDAESSAGACGLMQLMPTTAQWLSYELDIEYGKEKLFEPEYNIRLGIYYLSYLKEKFDGDYALAAYNAGEGNVEKWLQTNGEIRFSETRDYINKVNMAKKIYRLRIGA